MTRPRHSTLALSTATLILLSQQPLAGEKEHENLVYLHLNGLTSCAFDVDSYSISDDEPWGGVLTSYENGQCIITVYAGRHASDSVAQWFEGELGGGNAVACDSSGPLPEKLNFAIEGLLTLNKGTGTEDDPYVQCKAPAQLGQGSISHTFDNWWFGSSQAKSGGIPYIGPLIIACEEQTESTQTPNAKTPSRPSLPTLLTVSPPQPCVNNFSLVIN